jgi:hypothetical protein
MERHLAGELSHRAKQAGRLNRLHIQVGIAGEANKKASSGV